MCLNLFISFVLLCLLTLSASVASQTGPQDTRLKSFDVEKFQRYEEISLKAKKQAERMTSSQTKATRLNTHYSKNGTRFCENSLVPPDNYISVSTFEGDVVAMTAEERKGRAKCSFIGAVCHTEATEHSLVDRYLSQNDTVLETGARFGTTSCAIAQKQLNSGRLVSVEPDYRVWNLLDENRITHRCNFHLLRGVVGDRQVQISGTFYSTRTVNAGGSKALKLKNAASLKCASKQTTNLAENAVVESKPFYTFEQIQQVTKMNFTALLIDCEGCIETMFKGNTTSLEKTLQHVNTIILEADMPIGALDCEHNCVDYAKWVKAFDSSGLKVVYRERDPVYTKIYHYVFKR